MIWWPFNLRGFSSADKWKVVTHQWSGDLSINFVSAEYWRNDSRNSPMIWWPFNSMSGLKNGKKLSRNSPMIWWPFNMVVAAARLNAYVVTHQWSGDLSIFNIMYTHWLEWGRNSPMIWWPFNLLTKIDSELSGSRNSPMIWWPFNHKAQSYNVQTSVVTHQWSGDLSM